MTTSVTEISEYVRRKSCARRFKLGQMRDHIRASLPFFGKLLNTLDPETQRVGHLREDELQRYLEQNDYVEIVRPADSWLLADLAAAAASLEPGRSYFAREVVLQETIGAFELHGRLDYLLLTHIAGSYSPRIVEVKMSRKDQTYHRIQVASYQLLLGRHLASLALTVGGLRVTPDNVEGVVARVDEGTGRLQPILSLPPLDLELERTDVQRLLASDGILHQIAESELDELAYELSAKCDNCVFAVHCFPESARLRRVELTGAGPSALRALKAAGIHSIDALANLDPTSDAARAVRGHPAFNENLARLIQAARVRRSTLPPTREEAAIQISAEQDAAMLAQARQLFAQFKTCNVYSDAQYSFWLHSVRERYRAGALSAALLSAMTEMRFSWAPQVARLPYSGASQMPPHVIGERRLVRVYLSVHFDYIEHRIGAIAAHVTTSDGKLVTRFHKVNRGGAERFEPMAGAYELPATVNLFDAPPEAFTEPSGREVTQYKVGPWSTRFEDAVASERELLSQFFHTLTVALSEVARQPTAYVHLYVWSAAEMSQLVEACARADSQLLSSLRELLGCREPLEQIIYSSIGDQVHSGYALGWTSGGLVVATSVRWPGTYHWTRLVAGQPVRLDWAFRQDLFDFKTTLEVTADGQWDTEEGVDTQDDPMVLHTRAYFEIRSRFFDSLTPPYWRALWGTLQVPAGTRDARLQAQVNRYYESAEPGLMSAYLTARCHALRWIEERLQPKNTELMKAQINLRSLQQFTLGVDTTRRAALDFLQLEQFIKANNWLTACLAPPAVRVPSGKAIPVAHLEVVASNLVRGRIDLTRYECDLATLASRCSFVEDSFVRMSPCFADPERSQTVGQLFRGASTATITSLNWTTGEIELSIIPSRAQGGAELFVLPSVARDAGYELPECVILDESLSDFVAQRVHRRLTSAAQSQVYEWFHPQQPQIPVAPRLPEAQRAQIAHAVQTLALPEGSLASDQRDAIIAGLDARVQLLQGPPGTGKSTTLGIAIQARIAARAGVRDVIAIVANTHTAVDGLLEKVAATLGDFGSALRQSGLRLPSMSLFRLDPQTPMSPPVVALDPRAAVQPLRQALKAGVTVVAGTTSQLLKLHEYVSRSQPFVREFGGIQLKDLIVDEASMLLLPHFLSIATLLRADGCCLLAGDHRQLSPIVSQDWEQEERPPIQIYQPYLSAYEAIQNVSGAVPANPGRAVRTALNYSFRLPDVIRELIAPLYRRDNIRLDGRAGGSGCARFDVSPLQALWHPSSALVLAVHSEAESSRSNEYEAALIQAMVGACERLTDLAIGVVTPHRAQRVLLVEALARFGGAVSPIDTVERLQGGQRPTIIVSGTVSDPAVISRNAEFILNLNRANVAFSRAQERLIVVCAQTLLDAVPPDFEQYQSAFLWKGIRQYCGTQVADFEFQGRRVRLYIPSAEVVPATQLGLPVAQ